MEGIKMKRSIHNKLDGMRKVLIRESTKHWLNLAVIILVVLGIVGLVEIIGSRHHIRFDLTPTKRYTLSDHMRKILKSLEKDIEATVFYKPDELADLRDLLNRYVYESKKFSYRLFDLDRSPAMARQYEATAYGDTILECEGRKYKITYPNEEQMASAILRVTREDRPIIYFLSGHGEKSPFDSDEREGYSLAGEALEKEYYEVKELLLMREREIPRDASILVVSGPRKTILDHELQSIAEFIGQGGKALFMVDPYTSGELVEFLSGYGVQLGEDVVVDPQSRLVAAGYLAPIVPLYRRHPIAMGFREATIFPLVRSVEAREVSEEGMSAELLAMTSPGSWAETDRASVERGKPEFREEKDKPGPVSVAVVISIKPEAKEREKPTKARVVVYGDSDFANNFYINMLANRDLFLNTVNWLAEEEAIIGLRPKETPPMGVSPLFLTAKQNRMIFWPSVVFEPVLILIVGIVIYVRRRVKG
jgi:ABC-type uncharacterized transport system involved in gliding motility auxiliary subunit